MFYALKFYCIICSKCFFISFQCIQTFNLLKWYIYILRYNLFLVMILSFMFDLSVTAKIMLISWYELFVANVPETFKDMFFLRNIFLLEDILIIYYKPFTYKKENFDFSNNNQNFHGIKLFDLLCKFTLIFMCILLLLLKLPAYL
jgi:hypothetical protein